MVRWATLNKNGDLDGMASPHLNTGKFRTFYTYIHIFSPENESRKAAKSKGSWAHQQTDEITPCTIYIYIESHTHIYSRERERII